MGNRTLEARVRRCPCLKPPKPNEHHVLFQAALPLNLLALPTEVIHLITNWLFLQDIANLRLTCTALYSTCPSSLRFQSFFESKRVELTVDGLRLFYDGLGSGGLARSRLRNMTLSAPDRFVTVDLPTGALLPQRKETIEEVETKDREWLEKFEIFRCAFVQLAMHGPGLESLTLEVVCEEELQPSCYNIVTHENFELVLGALAEAQPRVQSVKFLHPTGGSSVELDMEWYSSSFIHLKQVNWNGAREHNALSSLTWLPSRTVEAITRPGSDQHENITDTHTGLASLIRLTPGLEALDWSFESLYKPQPSRPWIYEPIVKLCTEGSLIELSLCNVRGREQDLFAYITLSEVCHLFLSRVSLTKGTFRSSFDYCTSPDSRIIELSLDTLYEKSPGRLNLARVCFTCTGRGPSNALVWNDGDKLNLDRSLKLLGPVSKSIRSTTR
ncbi:hypothetical protein GE09DRAFT_590945 [Coniochaeta sp. 2T2.1]|nr:hypothetical protein GE09DRAFT_590945 [Coniochaeta sp. 2T2.1]